MNSSRKRLLEEIVFFSSKQGVKNPSKMMMYKLLAEADFRHFQETGLPITDLEYLAYPMGPVPEKLQEEVTKGKDFELPADFVDSLSVTETEFIGDNGKTYKGFKYIPKRKSDLKIFSPRQIRILEDVATIYKTATATEASEASHERGKPWTLTIKAHGVGAVIDMLETVPLNKPLTKEIAKDKMIEREALSYNYRG